jgi:hypothetical protein
VLSAYLSVLTEVAVEILVVFDRSNLLSFKDNKERVSQSLSPFGSLRMTYDNSFQKHGTKFTKTTTDFRVRVYTDIRNIQSFTLTALSSLMWQLGLDSPSEIVAVLGTAHVPVPPLDFSILQGFY